MAATVDELKVKNILETFRIEDLQTVLREFRLPYIGRKPELFQRVLSLIDDKTYDNDFCSKAKRKIQDIYSEAQNMAPTVNTFASKSKKSKSKRYESDDSYKESLSDEVSEEEEDTAFVVSDTHISYSEDDDKHKKKSKKSKKKKKDKHKRHSSKSTVNEDTSSSDSDSSDSTNDSDNIFSKYTRKSRSKRRKEKEKKKLKKKEDMDRKLKSKKKRQYKSSSSEDKSEDDIQQNLIKRKPKKKMKLLSSDEDSDHNNSSDNNSDDESPPEPVVTTTRRPIQPIVEDSSDDDIQFIACVPASQSTYKHNWINPSKVIKTNDQTDSSDTESLVEEPDVLSNTSATTVSAAPAAHQRKASESTVSVSANTNINTILKPTVNTNTSARILPEIQTRVVDSSDHLNQAIEELLESLSDSSDILLDIQTSNQNNNNNNTNKNAICDKRPEVVAPKVTSSSTSDAKSKAQTTPKSPPLLETKPTIPLAVIPPKVSKPEPAKPPEPQIPKGPCLPVITVRTPNKMPYRLYSVKNGQQIVIEPPPKLPSYVHIKVIQSFISIEKVKRILNGSSDDIEAIEQTLKVSLVCPISNQKVKVPSRSINCPHIDCFDINNFFEINFNKKIDDWKCPKCRQPAKLEQLIIDSLMDHILKLMLTLAPTVDTVLFDRTAKWVPDYKTSDNSAPTSSNNVISLDSTQDIIDLDDDDDDKEDGEISEPDRKANTNSLFNTFAQKIASAKNVQKDITNFINTNKQTPDSRRVTNPVANASIRLSTPATTSAPALTTRPVVIRPRPTLVVTNTTHTNLANHNTYRPPAPARPTVSAQNATNRSVTAAPRQTPSATYVNTTNTTEGDFVFRFANGVVSIVNCKLCNVNINVLNKNVQNLWTQHLNSPHHKALEARRSGQQNTTVAHNSNTSVNSVHQVNGTAAQPAYQQHYGFGAYGQQYAVQNQYQPTTQTAQHYDPNNMYGMSYMMPNVFNNQPQAVAPPAHQNGQQPQPQVNPHSATVYPYPQLAHNWPTQQPNNYYNGFG